MELRKKDIPCEYAYCFATEGQCPQCANCLHALIAKLPLEVENNYDIPVRTIDPRYVATVTAENPCPFFRSTAPKVYARGLKHLYDEVPGKVLRQVKHQVQYQVFSCSTFYFRARKGERLVSPQEQQGIAAVFKSLCPNVQPIYDSMEESYDW